MRLLGIDPGYAHLGFAVAEVGSGSRLRFLSVGALRTGAARARGQTKSAVEAGRIADVAGVLLELLREHRPAAICVEAKALPFGRVQLSVVSGLGRARGVVDGLAVALGLRVLEASPQRLKSALAGQVSASKLEVQRAVSRMYPELRGALLEIDASLREHAGDAAGVVHACLPHLHLGAVPNFIPGDRPGSPLRRTVPPRGWVAGLVSSPLLGQMRTPSWGCCRESRDFPVQR